MSELSNLRLLKLVRHIIKADSVKASHIVSRLAQKQGSTPYLVWLDQDDVGNMLVKMPPVEAAQMLEGLSGGRCGEILEKVGARNRWNAGKILSAMNRPKAAAVLSSMPADRRTFMLAGVQDVHSFIPPFSNSRSRSIGFPFSLDLTSPGGGFMTEMYTRTRGCLHAVYTFSGERGGLVQISR